MLTAEAGLQWDDAKVKEVFDRVDRDGNCSIERHEWDQLLGPQGFKALTDL